MHAVSVDNTYKWRRTVTFHRVVGTGRSRQITISIRARSRSIENVTDARLEKILAGVASDPRTDVFIRPS